MPQGGRRPGSGRKSLLEESTKVRLIRLCAARIIQALRSPELSVKDKAFIALEIAKRQIPVVTEEIGNVTKSIVFNITKNHIPDLNGETRRKDEYNENK